MHAESLPPRELGERLRMAREAAHLTQVAASNAIGVARPTLVAMEKGQRRVRIEELQELARLYGTNANALLRREAIHVDLSPRFRKMSGAGDEATQQAASLLADLAKAEVELENLLGVQRTVNYPPERPILSGNVINQAEHDALELRQRLGLGLQPVLDITTLLEFECGVRVYVRKLAGQVSGLFAFDDRLGACMLLNANQPRDRRNFTAAHELGHLVSTRREPDVVYCRSAEKSREERYADAFARSFLMPSRTVIQKRHEVTAGASTLTRRHVIVLAHAFGVSREAIVRRLEELEQTKPGAWDWFEAHGGITNDQVHQVLGDLVAVDKAGEDADLPTTLRLSALAHEVWRRELLSEGQLAKLLKIDRIALRVLLTDRDAEGEEDYDAPTLLR